MLKKLCFATLAVFGICLAFGGEEMISPLYYLSTDKPIYRPGEVVWLRAVVLDSVTNAPLLTYGENRGHFTICDGRGNEVFSAFSELENSTLATKWQIPEDAAGGNYTIKVTDEEQEGACGERTIEIRAFRTPRIKSQVDFLRRGYFPGETVSAFMTFSRAEGGIPENAVINACAMVDGIVVASTENLPYDKETGHVDFTFELPAQIANADATLSFVIQDGGVVESAAKTIPILLSDYEVAFYPESGDLIEGIYNRLYIQVLNRDGKGADVIGYIAPSDSPAPTEGAKFQALHEGRGIVEVTPEKGKSYSLYLPNGSGKSGAYRAFELPKSRPGATIVATQPAYPYEGKIALRVAVSDGSPHVPHHVILRKRKTELDKVKISTDPIVELDAKEAEGVLIATLYDKQNKPLAERLVFRLPKHKINIEIALDAKNYVPGGKVKGTILATNDKGTPIEAVLGIAAVDESVLEMRDKRDQAPRLPAMVFLEDDVLNLADAHIYLDETVPDFALKLDLLLGTQGWRRFVYDNPHSVGFELYAALLRAMGHDIPLHPERLYAVECNVAPNDGIMPRLMRNFFGVQEDAQKFMVEDEGMADVRHGPMLVAKDAEENAPADMAAREIMPAPPMRHPYYRPRTPYHRQYAFKVRKDRKPGDRTDFADTVYWNAALKTNARTGKAEFEFDLPDSVTAFRISTDAFANDSSFGIADLAFSSVEPFYIEPKYPVFLTTNDMVELPVVLINASNDVLNDTNVVVKFNGKVCKLAKTTPLPKQLKAGERTRIIAIVDTDGLPVGEYPIEIKGVAGNLADSVTRKIAVVSRNYPFAYDKGGRVSAQAPLTLEIHIPESTENGTQNSSVMIYTSPAANLEAALNALLRHPHGCFEQTSSTNYPLVMVQQYFTSHSGVSSAKIAQVNVLLEEGLKRLVSYECTEKGYEWFGENPGHEALTAYGLMQFADMAKVMPINARVIDDATAWLDSRRDGKGGYLRNDRALDSFGRAPKDTTDLYITWAMLESGAKPSEYQKEIELAKTVASASSDMYLKALAANIMALADRPNDAKVFADELAQNQNEDGSIRNVAGSITCSGGKSLTIEGTSLALLAWLKTGPEFTANIESGMKYLSELCENGRFGTTQSTILALKAINAYDKQFAKPLAPGSLMLYIDGQPFGNPVNFTESTTGILQLPNFGLKMTPGRHVVEIRMTDGSELAASIHFDAMCAIPNSQGDLALQLKLNADSAKEGAPLQLNATLTNNAKSDANMPVAVIAIPGNLKVRTEQLKELVDAKTIAAYETKDNCVVVYLRGLRAGESKSFPISLIAEIPGTCQAASSYAYLFYQDELKCYATGVTATVE